MKFSWDHAKIWVAALYVLLAAAALLTAGPWLLSEGVSCSSATMCIKTLRGFLLLGALVALFAVIFFFFIKAWTWGQVDRDHPVDATDKVFFPHGATRPVAWIVFFWLVASLAGLFMIFWDPWHLAEQTTSHVYEMLLAVFSAGAGSSVATIMAYLAHASRLGDFNYSYVPWYLMRPLLGSLLGLIFYFLMRGGIIAILENPPTNDNFDDLALAGISSLVGLFSNEAYMKLQEVFNTLFKIDNYPVNGVNGAAHGGGNGDVGGDAGGAGNGAGDRQG